VEVGQGLVHRRDILLHDLLALAAIGFLDREFDLLDGLVARKHAGERKKARLHDRIDAGPHAGGFGDADRINYVELRFLLDQPLLNEPREVLPDFVGAEMGVEEESASGHKVLEHVVPV